MLTVHDKNITEAHVTLQLFIIEVSELHCGLEFVDSDRQMDKHCRLYPHCT